MKTLILLLFGVTIVLANAAEDAAKEELARMVALDATRLRELLNDNWTIRANENEITLTAKFEVFIIGLVSRGDPPPAFSDKTPRKVLLNETQPNKYVIRLRYEERMPSEEYARRRQERQKLAHLMSLGSKTKSEAGEKTEQFNSLKMPRYRADLYDVYQELSCYGEGVLVYPPKALQKAGGAKEILAAVLHQVLTDID